MWTMQNKPILIWAILLSIHCVLLIRWHYRWIFFLLSIVWFFSYLSLFIKTISIGNDSFHMRSLIFFCPSICFRGQLSVHTAPITLLARLAVFAIIHFFRSIDVSPSAVFASVCVCVCMLRARFHSTTHLRNNWQHDMNERADEQRREKKLPRKAKRETKKNQFHYTLAKSH